jgi:hypothetical protein
MHRDRWRHLERARQRRDQAAPGSPEWDAASEAVLELEAQAREVTTLTEQLRRQPFFAEARAAS